MIADWSHPGEALALSGTRSSGDLHSPGPPDLLRSLWQPFLQAPKGTRKGVGPDTDCGSDTLHAAGLHSAPSEAVEEGQVCSCRGLTVVSREVVS